MRPNQSILAANRDIAQSWVHRLTKFDGKQDGQRSTIELLASSHREGKACKVIQRIIGAFNYCFRIRFDEDDKQWILRFPVPGSTMSPSQKVQVELATMRFVRDMTTIPIPKVVASGELIGLGPYILMEFIPGRCLDDLILDDEGKLRQDIGEASIRKIYQQLANFHLQLTSCSFDKIGSLLETSSRSGRQSFIGLGPLTFKSNEIERMGGVKSEEFSKVPYDSASAYIDALLDQSLRHLKENPMASRDEEEARSDYRAIRALKSAMPSFSSANDGPFLLFNDDLRFGNMIVDKDLNICAIIDWEFCYVAPASFLKSPPCWLIGLDPFEWDDHDLQEYDKRLGIYLELMREEEEKAHRSNDLSTSMQRSREDGTFWFNLAVREPFPLRPIMSHCWELDAIRKTSPPKDLDEFGCEKMDQRRRYELGPGR